MTFQRGDIVWIVTTGARMRAFVALATPVRLILIFDGFIAGHTEVMCIERRDTDQSRWMASDGTIVTIEPDEP